MARKRNDESPEDPARTADADGRDGSDNPTHSYAWEPGSGLRIDANVVGRELERIRQADPSKALQAAALVDAASDRSHPLHSLFNWDDTEAAELYRQSQARGIIRRLRIVQHPGSQREPRRLLIAYTAPAPAAKSGYLETATVLADDKMREQVVRNALAALRGWLNRYGEIEELAEVASAIRRAVKKVAAELERKEVETAG